MNGLELIGRKAEWNGFNESEIVRMKKMSSDGLGRKKENVVEKINDKRMIKIITYGRVNGRWNRMRPRRIFEDQVFLILKKGPPDEGVWREW